MLAAIGIFSFHSCDENTENSEANEENDSSGSLVGTYWVAESFFHGEGRQDPIREGEKYELIFTSGKEVSLCVAGTYLNRENKVDVLTLGGTYEYDHPEIAFFGVQYDTKHFMSQFGLLDGAYGPSSIVMGDDTMIVQIFLGGDILWSVEFRKQEQPISTTGFKTTI